MAGEEQERFEDYLELERYIEELQAGHAAHPPKDLTPDQARIYQMAALLRSALPEAAEPRPEFAEQLKARLIALDEEGDDEETQKLPIIRKPVVPEVPVPPTQYEGQQQEVQQPAALPQKAAPKRARFVSRRSLLAGGAVAAASLVIGASAEYASEQVGLQHSQQGAEKTYATPLVHNIPTTWLAVTTLAQLGDAAIRFVTDTVIGYVIRDDNHDKDSEQNKVIAMSAACTHMGCIVQWQSSDRQFHCPCHGGVFTEYGDPSISASKIRYLSALPRLNTKVEGGKVFVEVPTRNT